MKTKRQLHFAYFWQGFVHLDDGSEWFLADPSWRHDVIWWQSGETVKLDRHHGQTLLRNLIRGETVSLETAETVEWKLAA